MLYLQVYFTFSNPNLTDLSYLILIYKFYISKSKVYDLKLPLGLLCIPNKTFTFVKSTKNGAKTPLLTRNDTMKDRIRQVMETMHMSQQVFAQYIDMSPASLSSIFNGRTQPTLKIVEAIKKKFPDISTDWLMFGSGTMYSTQPDGGENLDGGQTAETKTVVSLEPTLDFDAAPSPTPQHAAPVQLTVDKSRESHREVIREEVKYIDRPQRKVMEIRVYYDDLTFESFVPAKK